MRSLIDERVDAIIGPFTSADRRGHRAAGQRGRVVMVSPRSRRAISSARTTTSCINRTTRDNATDYAGQLARRGQRRAAVAYDTGNRSYSESWLGEFPFRPPPPEGRWSPAVPFTAARHRVR